MKTKNETTIGKGIVTEHEYDKVIKKCKLLMLQRNKKYGDSYRVLRVDSIIDLIHAKIIRLSSLTNKQDMLLELEDILNYAAFAQMRLYER